MHKIKLPMSSRSGVLTLGAVEVRGYKLADGRRVIVQSDAQSALGLARGRGGAAHSTELARFFSTNALKPYAGNALRHATEPVEFTTPDGGHYLGYDVRVILDGALAIDNADRAGKLNARHAKIAAAVRAVLHGLAGVGLDVVFDEAVGDAQTKHADDLRQYVDRALAAQHKALSGEIAKRDDQIAALTTKLDAQDEIELDLIGYAVATKSVAGRALAEARHMSDPAKQAIKLRKAEAQEKRDRRRGQTYIFTLRRPRPSEPAKATA